MSSDVTIALITGGAAVLGQLIIAYSNRRRMEETHLDSLKLLEFKIDKLSEKQDKYNHLQERTYRLEEKASLTDEKFKVANHRISDLENIERK